MSPEQGYYEYEGDAALSGGREASTMDAGDAHACAPDAPAEHAVADMPAAARHKARIAAFDFDGTSMDGNSPVRLVLYLMKKNMLPKVTAIRIGLWAARYKLRLPQNEAWVRGMVFRAFEGKPKREVDQFLADFYDEDIAPRFRQKAHETMQRHHDAGDTVLVISASFEPIVTRMMQFHPVDGQVSTRMRVNPDGTYTCEVEGKPIEGEEKLFAINRWCNDRYGEGNWELAYAYGDHHSDRPMLEAAKKASAVDPDRPLTRTAKANGWPILDW